MWSIMRILKYALVHHVLTLKYFMLTIFRLRLTPGPLSGRSKEVAETEEGGGDANFHQEDSAALSTPRLDIVIRWAHFGWAVSFQSLLGIIVYVIA